jgi:bifunctional polynucleotide phosphatase/kinase
MFYEETAPQSFFLPNSQKKPEAITWRVVNKTLVVGKYAADSASARQPSSGKPKIAAFDFVGYPS